MGYGIVVGLDGTGDRATGGRSGGQTVQSVANLLRRFNVEVPQEMLSLRNVAAVLVTAEVSPYLRPGGRFEVSVSSLGDARSIRGGVLWMTPLVADVGGEPLASAQGPMLISESGGGRGGYSVETTARIPGGGILEGELARPQFATTARLVLREPDLGTATRVAAAINAELGAGAASVEDPGSVALTLAEGGDRAVALARIGDLRVQPDRASRVVIDSRSGTVVAGGELQVGPASISHGGVTLTVGAGAARGAAGAGRGNLSVPTGTTVQQVTSALYAADTSAQDIAAILEALHRAGALAAEVVIR